MISDSTYFIGETKLNNDLEIYEGLSKFQKQRIENLAHKVLIDNKFHNLPINLIRIIENQSWTLISFIEAKKKLEFLCEYIDFKDWGYSMTIGNRSYILYDNTISIEAQRFTIAHEIGHLILNHNKYNRGKIRDDEANLFASHLLMPTLVLKESAAMSIDDISRMCGVNKYWAKQQFQRIQNLTSEYLNRDIYNNKIKSLFNAYIKKEKRNNIKFENIDGF